ncbi:DNA methyltransferase [Aeromicrobium halocynthiae]
MTSRQSNWSRRTTLQHEGTTIPSRPNHALQKSQADSMRHLVRLVTPPGGLVLDPFAGSGTTAEACAIEGFASISVEREPDYIALIHRRLARRLEPVTEPADAWTLPL